MAVRTHRKDDGTQGICRASKRPCPKGVPAEEHLEFESLKAVRAYNEERLAEELPAVATVGRKSPQASAEASPPRGSLLKDLSWTSLQEAEMSDEAYYALREQARLRRLDAFPDTPWVETPIDGNLTAEEVAAQRLPFVEKAGMAYEEEGYTEINAHLRGESASYTPHRRRKAEHLVDLYGEYYERVSVPLPQDTVLMRGDPAMWGQERPKSLEGVEVGTVLADPGYQSFSKDFMTASSFSHRGTGEGWVTVTEVPAGTPAVVGHEGEWELILPPGTRHEVVAIDAEERRIHCRVAPPEGA